MIGLKRERRLFQLVVLAASLVPVSAGAAGAWLGPAMIARCLATNADLANHFRYLSGLLLGIGIAFPLIALNIEARAREFRKLGLIVIAGGLARALGFARDGLPSRAHQLALVMELLVVPALLLWLGRLQRLASAS